MDTTVKMYQRISKERIKTNSIAFKAFILLLTLYFFVATPIAVAVTGIDSEVFWGNLIDLLVGPSKLITDYFALGCLASTLFNAGIWPVTVVSDIIRPGGLRRFKQLADDVSKCDYAQFSGILTSDLPDIEKEVSNPQKEYIAQAMEPFIILCEGNQINKTYDEIVEAIETTKPEIMLATAPL